MGPIMRIIPVNIYNYYVSNLFLFFFSYVSFLSIVVAFSVLT